MQIIRRDCPEVDHLPDNLHPLLKRVYAARDIQEPTQLDYSLSGLHPYGDLHGIDDAVALLQRVIAAGRRILIVADFDADGATACALAVRGLTAMGAQDVRYVVPNRFEYGYGLSPEIVAVAAEQQPDLIMTVDNGIASVDGVTAARERGMQVIITDHHLAPQTLPAADAIVNPNLPHDPFPSKYLAGVGVMFYVLIALRVQLRAQGWFEQQGLEVPNLAQWLDLVALGTVADVVPLDHNNRILVAQGLMRMRSHSSCAGIRALLTVAGRQPQQVTAMDLGFCVAPRLNAAGRLTDMTVGIECLLTNTDESAKAMARQLDTLNRQRRDLQDSMHEDAEQYVAELRELTETGDELPSGLCLYREDWHQGLVGLVAARVKDQIHRPVIAFAPAADGTNALKGSARSIPGVHIRDALAAVATRHPHVITKFGGHAMAAGLSLEATNYEAFAMAFADEIDRMLGGEVPVGTILSDGGLEPRELSVRTAEVIARGGPWGQGFPEPVFDGEFELVERKIVGGRHLSLKLQPPGTNRPIKAIAFGTDDSHWPARVDRVAAAFRLDIDTYGGRRQLQLMVEHLTPL